MFYFPVWEARSRECAEIGTGVIGRWAVAGINSTGGHLSSAREKNGIISTVCKIREESDWKLLHCRSYIQGAPGKRHERCAQWERWLLIGSSSKTWSEGTAVSECITINFSEVTAAAAASVTGLPIQNDIAHWAILKASLKRENMIHWVILPMLSQALAKLAVTLLQ